MPERTQIKEPCGPTINAALLKAPGSESVPEQRLFLLSSLHSSSLSQCRRVNAAAASTIAARLQTARVCVSTHRGEGNARVEVKPRERNSGKLVFNLGRIEQRRR